MAIINPDKPLWLPQGSVRAVLAIGLVGAFIAGLVDIEIATMVVGFYFVQRSREKATDGR